jgi:hypothetical protein
MRIVTDIGKAIGVFWIVAGLALLLLVFLA